MSAFDPLRTLAQWLSKTLELTVGAECQLVVREPIWKLITRRSLSLARPTWHAACTFPTANSGMELYLQKKGCCMINSKLCSASAVIIALAAAIAAPGTAVAEGTEDTAEVGEPAGNMIARDVLDTIKANYVLTPKIPAITKTIKAGLASGRYASLEGRALADRLNEDLTAAAHDKHLAIQFDPARASMISGPMGDEINEGPEWERMAQTMNHGVAEMRLMDGNVRYMNLVGFAWTGAKSAAALDNAMRFLSEGDAAIIDLRYNGGGSPRAIEYLFSHFVEPGKTLMTFYMGGGKAPTHHAALRELPAGRLSGKPLYVLTSKMSISAAEAFAALVQDYHVGDIVGETTAGAAYRNSYFPIAGKYLLSVSVGRGEIGPSKDRLGGSWHHADDQV
jgi:hypothetical protein